MAALSTQQRKNLDKSQFVFPEKAPGPGSYPIPDMEHGRKALQLSGGKPEEGRVRAAVKRKFPNIGKEKEGAAEDKAEGPMGEAKEKMANGRMNDYMRRRAGVRTY